MRGKRNYLVAFFALVLFTQVATAQIDNAQKLKISKEVERTLNDYKKYAGLTPNFQISENIDAGYVTQFSKLFLEKALVYNDLQKQNPEKLIAVSDYVDFLKTNYSIGLAVKNVSSNYYVVRPNPDKATAADAPNVIRINVSKTWYGYFQDSIYTEKTVALNVYCNLSADYKILGIAKIEPVNNAEPKDTVPNPNQAQIDKLSKKAAALNKKIEALQAQVKIIDSEIERLDVKPDTEKNLAKEFEQKWKPQK